MKIAVTDTGKPEKQKQYLDWLASHQPEAALVVVSYHDGLSHHPDLSKFDGLVLTGGEDVDPDLSKAEPRSLVGPTDRRRDDFELSLLDQAMKHQKPVLGICRGLQVANVFFGGTLIADLPAAGFKPHASPKGMPEMMHTVTIDDGTLLKEIAGVGTGVINSYHHQAVAAAGDGLMIAARADDGTLEALEWKEKSGKPYVMLVQWHPERMNDRNNLLTSAIARSFFAAVENNSMK